MQRPDQADFIGGLLMAGIGVFAALYARHYDFGSARQMGPGYFPVIVGWLMAALGAAIAIQAVIRGGEGLKPALFPPALVLGVVVLFGLMLDRAGLVLTLLLCLFLLTFMSRNLTLAGRLLASVAITLFSMAIFVGGLGVYLPLWPAFLINGG